MFKSYTNLFIFLILFLTTNISAQNEHSIQFNGGILFPRSSSNGFSSSLIYSYSLNSTFGIYIYTGYNSWDRFNVTYVIELIPPQTKSIFNSYSSDNHILIPAYFGSRINLHTNKLFTSFLNFEIGYSYFGYNSYDNIEIIDSDTGEILDYRVNKESKKEKTDNLFGIGIGAGLSYPISNTFDVILSYRLNSNFNSGEFGLFSAKGTYYSLLTGLNIKL